jgi:hypothetical protein
MWEIGGGNDGASLYASAKSFLLLEVVAFAIMNAIALQQVGVQSDIPHGRVRKDQMTSSFPARLVDVAHAREGGMGGGSWQREEEDERH